MLEFSKTNKMGRIKKYGLDGEFTIMYSSNIGLYYDLKNWIKVIKKIKNAKTLNGRDVFWLVLVELKKYKKNMV